MSTTIKTPWQRRIVVSAHPDHRVTAHLDVYAYGHEGDAEEAIGVALSADDARKLATALLELVMAGEGQT